MGGHIEIQEWREMPHQRRSEEIVIRFRITFEESDRHAVSGVTAEIYRAAAPADVVAVEPLRFGHETSLRISFRAARRVHGWLRWGSGLVVEHAQQITGRIEIADGEDFEFWTYQGFMIEFGSRRPHPLPPPPVPDPVPLPGPLPIPSPADGFPVADVAGEAGELFPFVCLKTWPKITPRRVATGFMTVPQPVQAGTFYEALKAASAANRRQIAVDFINAAPEPPAPGHFLPRHAALASPFGVLTQLPHALRTGCTHAALDAWIAAKFGSLERLASDLKSADAIAARTDIWNTVTALLIVPGYDHGWLAELIRLLQVTHLVDAIIAAGETEPSDLQMTRLLAAVFLLPADIFPVSPLPAPNVPPAIKPYAVGAVRTVHYRPGPYLLGDIERIESIMAGETREEGQRDLRRMERLDAEDSVTESTGHTARDTATADLIAEVQKTLSSRKATTTVNSYKADYGPPDSNTMTVTGDWTIADDPAGGDTKDIAKFARDIIERSVKVLHRQALARRRSMVLSETETTRRRTLSNREGETNRQAIYRWVNRAYHLETRTAPDRLVFQILLDRPATHLRDMFTGLKALTGTAPPTPASLGIRSYADLLPERPGAVMDGKGVCYLDAFAAYDIPPDPAAPAFSRTIGTSIRSRDPLADTEIEVPEGYAPQSATACITSLSSITAAMVFVGGAALSARPGTPKPAGSGMQDDPGDPPAPGAPVNSAVYACDLSNTPAALAQRLPVSILFDPEQAPKSTGEVNATFNATIQIECSLRPARLSNWQMGAFLMIKSAYEARRRAFEDDLAARQRDLRVHNPLLLRQIVREQLVQAAISEFAKSTLPLPDMGVFTPPDHEPRYARFLRDAFDWDGMSVEVYGESQPDAFMDEGQTALIALYDPSLSLVEFLRASQARLLVAARPEAARPLLLALRIGEIWPCAPDLTPCMAGDEAIVDQIIAGEGERERDDGPGDRWSIIIPTSMVALASDDPFR